MSRLSRSPIVALGVSALLLGACQLTVKPSPPPTYQPANVAGGDAKEEYTTEPTPRRKPEHAKPLAEMTCVELDAAMSDYRQKMRRNDPVYRSTPPAGAPTGGLLGVLATAAIQQEQRFAYEDARTLMREALPVYEQRGCGAELAQIRAAAAAQWARMDKWSGSIQAEEDLGAGSTADGGCNIVPRKLVIGIEHDQVRGSLTLPGGGVAGMLEDFDVPLQGSFDTTNKTLKAESEGRYAFRFAGNLEGGRWSYSRCSGTFKLTPLPS